MYDDNEPLKKKMAIEVFERETGDRNDVVSTQVLQEFYVNATRKLSSPLSPERAEARVRDFSRLPLVRLDANIILSSIHRSRRDVLSFGTRSLSRRRFLRGRGGFSRRIFRIGGRSRVCG